MAQKKKLLNEMGLTKTHKEANNIQKQEIEEKHLNKAIEIFNNNPKKSPNKEDSKGLYEAISYFVSRITPISWINGEHEKGIEEISSMLIEKGKLTRTEQENFKNFTLKTMQDFEKENIILPSETTVLENEGNF